MRGSASAEMVAHMIRMGTSLVEANSVLFGTMGAGPTQIGMMTAAGQFAIAAAIHDLASAVRDSNSTQPKEPTP